MTHRILSGDMWFGNMNLCISDNPSPQSRQWLPLKMSSHLSISSACINGMSLTVSTLLDLPDLITIDAAADSSSKLTDSSCVSPTDFIVVLPPGKLLCMNVSNSFLACKQLKWYCFRSVFGVAFLALPLRRLKMLFKFWVLLFCKLAKCKSCSSLDHFKYFSTDTRYMYVNEFYNCKLTCSVIWKMWKSISTNFGVCRHIQFCVNFYTVSWQSSLIPVLPLAEHGSTFWIIINNN